jgi:L-amino acid N-acyltransferase
MPAQIRFAELSDLPEILEIYNHAILNTTAVYDYKAHTLNMRKQWWDNKQENLHPILVAVQEGKIAGFASYGKFRIWAAYKYSMEHSLYVHPLFQGKGIGKNLLQNLISEAEKRDVHSLIGGIDKDNNASLSLHAKFGFEEVGHLKEVGFKFGQWRDLVFVQLLLNTPNTPKDD